MNPFEFGFGGDFDESAMWAEPDIILSEIVGTLVNILGMPIGITLFVKGMVISGVLVSEREYLEALSQLFRRMTYTDMKSPDAKDDDDAFDLFDFTVFAESTTPPIFSQQQQGEADGVDYLGFDDDDDDLDDDDMPVPGMDVVRHLHLKDVLILNPEPTLSFNRSPMPIIRLRLSLIDGWMIGQASEGPPTDHEEDQKNGGEILH